MAWAKKQTLRVLICCLCGTLITLLTCPALPAADYQLSKGQTLYVPVYSNIYSSPKAVPYHLANILSIRNTDPAASIRVTTVDYFDTKGKLVKRHYAKPVVLAPLESTHVYLSENAKEGGFGANFIVKWKAEQEVNAPLIECVMAGSQGRAFIASGRVIKDPAD